VKSQGKEQTASSGQAVSDKTPRNAPCPCGSGKKYKKCHGAVV
jgi:preprotein translocase subunit SecA